MVRQTRRALAATIAAALFVVIFGPLGGRAQELGWSVTDFAAVYRITDDGTLAVEERITVDFGTLQRRGILRDLIATAKCGAPVSDAEQPLEPCPDGWVRKWEYRDFSVLDETGQPRTFARETLPGAVRLRIGDADRTVSGEQTYVIRYTVRGALDAYASHHELYWNVTGSWQVPIERFSLTVALPAGAEPRAACFAGLAGSEERCTGRVTGSSVTFLARQLETFEQVTVAVGWQRGLVTVRPPLLVKPASLDDYLKLDPLEWAGFAVTGVAGVAAAVALWWRAGRDRQYRSIYYLTNDPTEGRKPLFGGPPLVVEYLPPEDLRPAQMGVLLDERADDRDITATIIDLAVRGYLRITEIELPSGRGQPDWTLEKLREGDDLQPFERELFLGLFASSSTVSVSSLRYRSFETVNRTKRLVEDDAVSRRWFALRPSSAKGAAGLTAFGWLAATVGAMLLSATVAGRALLPAGFGLGGLVLLVLSPSMSRRTAMGSELLRRVLGFRLYIVTAETHRQRFNEEAGIFARYLPHAIVFDCVDKWAKAFAGLDDEVQRTATWYTGRGPFHVTAFTAGITAFSRTAGSSLASRPRSSRSGSGFSGGRAGGGGGGGGGGSW